MGTHKTSLKAPLKWLFGILLVLLATTVPICNTKKVAAQPPPPTDLGVFTTPRLLSITKSGAGTGIVTAVGINCGTNCFQNYEDGTVTVLTASPNSGSTFAGWSGGGCSGTGTCSVTMSSAQSVIATFSTGATRFASPTGQSTGQCTSNTSGGTNGRCDVWRLLQVITCGETGQLNNGTYQGTRYMFDTRSGAAVVGSPACSSGHEIIIRAETDGQVFIDAQGARVPFAMVDMSWWKLSGFDVGNAGGANFRDNFNVHNSSNNTFQRICISNQIIPYPVDDFLADGLRVENGSSNNLFEDICSFGTAGNNMIDKDQSTNNTYRRMWLRWEGGYQFYGGGPLDCGGPPFQIGYGAHHTSTFENIITIYDPEQTPAGSDCTTSSNPGTTVYGSTLVRDVAYPSDTGYVLRGWVAYGYTSPRVIIPSQGSGTWFYSGHNTDQGEGGHQANINIQDLFVDAMSQPTVATGPIGIGCDLGFCSNTSLNRITSLRGSSQGPSNYTNSGSFALFSNINECTSAGACPDFYTGTLGGASGARNCLEYSNGSLTSTKLWPWRMDDRIKAALARANAAGLGGSPLQGSAGSGGTSTWAAGTVTSEIVSRYGAIPLACVR